MRTSPTKQRGLTFISMVLLLGLIAFFTMLVLKIAPIYFNHSKVVNALKALEQTTDLTTKTRTEVLNSLQKRFDMNYVEYVTMDDVKVQAQPGYCKVNIDYERVEHLVGNLSVLVDFHEGFVVGDK
jgi:hypothetical protein